MPSMICGSIIAFTMSSFNCIVICYFQAFIEDTASELLKYNTQRIQRTILELAQLTCSI